MEFKELILFIINSDEERQDFISTVERLDEATASLEEKLTEASYKPWKDKSKGIFSKALGWLNHDPGTVQWIKKNLYWNNYQASTARQRLTALEKRMDFESEYYLINHPTYDTIYTSARGHHNRIFEVISELNALTSEIHQCTLKISGAWHNFGNSRRSGNDTSYWLKWAEFDLKDARKRIDNLNLYDGTARSVGDYLPKEAATIITYIQQSRLKDMDELEPALESHFQEFETYLEATQNLLWEEQDKYKTKMGKRVKLLIDRILDGAV